MRKRKVIFVFGTRPEAIKMAPVIMAFDEVGDVFKRIVVVTAQHRHMLDQVLKLFGLKPNYDLDIMVMNQKIDHVLSRAVQGLSSIYDSEKPDMVFVQGDTTTTFAGAISAFHHHIPVAHIEAGLRTLDKSQPFPEEVNRRLTSVVADLHFAPTEQAKRNLVAEGVPETKIFITGNTVIDALLYILGNPVILPEAIESVISRPSTKLILATIHRRENHGEGLKAICAAILDIVASFGDVDFIIPVHPNPNVRAVIEMTLGNNSRIHLFSPMDYEVFVHVMNRCYLILTDSGGIQEEAPSLGKPVLVLREKTERPEALIAGTVRLVGTERVRICTETARLLSDQWEYESMARSINPYGDGRASGRIVTVTERYFRENGE